MIKLNLTEELGQLMYLANDVGVKIRWLNQCPSSAEMVQAITLLSGIFLKHGAIADSVLHSRSDLSLLLKHCDEFIVHLNELLNHNLFAAMGLTDDFSYTFSRAVFALESIKYKCQPIIQS